MGPWTPPTIADRRSALLPCIWAKAASPMSEAFTELLDLVTNLKGMLISFAENNSIFGQMNIRALMSFAPLLYYVFDVVIKRSKKNDHTQHSSKLHLRPDEYSCIDVIRPPPWVGMGLVRPGLGLAKKGMLVPIHTWGLSLGLGLVIVRPGPGSGHKKPGPGRPRPKLGLPGFMYTTTPEQVPEYKFLEKND
ncbi:hypothetical protein KSP40_PGU017405 [Platanthera guangdongensis]|uniref:Uncharacterized protein n=1 Tax=Platanthera guangdongensis TaxID=2320717 RepID=A0ABR2LM17_9ASPA